MRSIATGMSLRTICRWFGVTRQAYYQHHRAEEIRSIQDDLILKGVKEIRVKHRRLGGRNLFEKLQEFFELHNISMGRDKFFSLLRSNNMTLRRRKRSVTTTFSRHRFRKYPNLLPGITIDGPNQVWVSDITYWRINTYQHLYVSFITDAYSRMIVGYHVAETLEAIETVQALVMALASTKAKSTRLHIIVTAVLNTAATPMLNFCR